MTKKPRKRVRNLPRVDNSKRMQKARPTTKNIGRPTLLTPLLIRQATELYAGGYTDNEVAAFFNIGVSTLLRWSAESPAFREAQKIGKDVPDDRVERSLYQKAIGYTVETERAMLDKQGKVHKFTDRQHVPADTTSAIFWLKNRRRDKWQERRSMDVTGQISLEQIILNSYRDEPPGLPAPKVIEGEIVQSEES